MKIETANRICGLSTLLTGFFMGVVSGVCMAASFSAPTAPVGIGLFGGGFVGLVLGITLIVSAIRSGI